MPDEQRMVFVLEQALGHMTHGRNIERVLAEAPGIAPSVIRIEQPPAEPDEPAAAVLHLVVRGELGHASGAAQAAGPGSR